MTGHLTPREKAARASAATAIARARAHIRPPQDDDHDLAALYPYVTQARARQIRHELQEIRNARRNAR